ncbi:MAG TPA: Rne/Rng family ribonuclease [Victivallales bacterium]|nr:Rne/Rng family ribonuclease [Victivallales bacterium]
MYNSGRKIIINSEKLETRVALLNNNRLEEYQMERKNKDNIVGSVFLGRIANIQTSLKAVFVDIGLGGKNAFMHFSDMLPATYDEINLKKTKKSERRIRPDDIPELFPVNSMLFVQVTKGSIGTKGPRVTTNIAIPGRYFVLLPYSYHLGISRRIDDYKERNRLKKIMLSLPLPKGMGGICRTVAEGRKSLYFKREINMLLEEWRKAENIKKKSDKVCLVYQEPSLVEKSMRDFLEEDISEVIIDSTSDYTYIKDFIAKIVNKRTAAKIKLYRNPTPIFEKYNVEEKISVIFDRQVSLPSGGYICIDETEALISIDINTGSTKGEGKNDEVILQTNTEASEEIARQLRLRNIGGLVVIDYIDMMNPRHNDIILKLMRKLLKNDRAKSKILPISSLGLMQMTRQREQQSLLDRIYDPCPYCKGSGKVKSPMSISVEIQRMIKEVLKRRTRSKDLSVRVIMNPTILTRLKNDDEQFLEELENKYGKDLSFRADPTLHIEEFQIIDPETGKELFK